MGFFIYFCSVNINIKTVYEMKKVLLSLLMLIVGIVSTLAQNLTPYAEVSKKNPNDPNSLDLIITYRAARNPSYSADKTTGIGTYSLLGHSSGNRNYALYPPSTYYVPGSVIKDDHFNFHITEAIVDESMKDAIPLTSGDFLFAYMPSLKTITGMENLNTSEMTDMQYMFSHDYSLESIDLSHFDTRKVTNMGQMFQTCKSLTALDVSSFETSNVTNMSMMFSQCFKVTTPNFKFDPAKFKTDNVTNMSYMFQTMRSMTSIDISSFNTSNVTNMMGMFALSSSLTSINLGNINTAKVENMSKMFQGCTNLPSVDVKTLNTQSVTDMGLMFSDCTSLSSVDVSNFNVNNVTTMSSMFDNCTSLKSLDISKWAINTGGSVSFFANGCTSLAELNLGANDISAIRNKSFAFYDVGKTFPCHITFTFDRSKLGNVTIDKTNPLPPYYTYYDGRFYIAEKLDCDRNLAEDYTPVAKANTDLWQANRALTTNDWNTLVVPVALTRAQLEQSFGTGVQVCRLVGYSGKTLHFKTVGTGESIPANEPVLVKPAEDIKNIGYAVVNIETPTNDLTKETEESSEKKAYLIGSYKSKITLADILMYYSPSYHYFIRSNGNATIRKTRAYLKLSDHPTAALSVAIDDNGISTNINSIDGTAIGQPEGPAYNLSGQRVGNDYKGIVIVNGKKLLRK